MTLSFHDIAMNDYDGDPLPFSPRARESLAEDSLRLWCENDPEARQLIESTGIRDAIVKYVEAYNEIHEAEYNDNR